MRLAHADATVELSAPQKGVRQLSITPKKNQYIHRATCHTRYPPELVQQILNTKGPGYVCDEIARDEDPTYIAPHIRATLFAHVPPSAFAGKRLLDFGCGSGASTMTLARLLPHTEIVGVELEKAFIQIAKERARFYGVKATFLQSPSGDSLPKNLGTFDFIFLPAVYEHLLPAERKTVIPMLWKLLKPNGVLLIDETPWRWFPVETHTSSLPLVNYLPRFLAHPFTQRFSRRGLRNDTWPELLRKGIRGASVREIKRDIRRVNNGTPTILRPQYEGMRTPIDVWIEGYARKAPGKGGIAKRALGTILKCIFFLTRIPAVPYLSLAIKKTRR